MCNFSLLMGQTELSNTKLANHYISLISFFLIEKNTYINKANIQNFLEQQVKL